MTDHTHRDGPAAEPPDTDGVPPAIDAEGRLMEGEELPELYEDEPEDGGRG